MTEVHVVWAHLQNGPRYPLKVFTTAVGARHYVEMVTRHPWDDEARMEMASAAETLGISAVTVEALPVEPE